MSELARGSVSDRPWGMTLWALGRRGLTGELTLHASDNRVYRIAFAGGAVVGSHSPLITDAAVRLALTSNLITTTQVADITRRMAAAPDREEVELLGELARLSPEQIQRIRRRLVAQRAARTFSVEHGEFTVHDEVTVSVVPGSELDVRAIIYLGAKANLSEQRLGEELGLYGGWFRIKPDSVGDLVQYGFTEAEKRALQMLVEGTNVADLEAEVPEIEPRIIRAVTYALASCGACEMTPEQPRKRPTSSSPPSVPRTVTGQPGSGSLGVPRTTTRQPDSGSLGVPRATTRQPGSGTAQPEAAQLSRTMSPTSGAVPRASDSAADGSVRINVGRAPTRNTGSMPSSDTAQRAPTLPPGQRAPTLAPGQRTPTLPPGVTSPLAPTATPMGSPRTRSATLLPRTKSPTIPPGMGAPSGRTNTPPAQGTPVRRARRVTAATLEVEQLLDSKMHLLDSGADHFALFGLSPQASAAEVQQTYFMLARKLHPDRLLAIGVVDPERQAQRLMAQLNAAFAVLNDPGRRAEYESVLARGGEAVVRAEHAQADELAMAVMRAEDAFKQGEMMLRREQLAQAIESFKVAVDLQPGEPDYQALYAWAKFAAAPDKNAVATETRKALLRAAEANFDLISARFYLGRVERMLGREKEALSHFAEVLRVKPSHSEAMSEFRVLEARVRNKR